MSLADLSQYGLDREESGDDTVVPFALESLDCRGRSVRLGPAINTILTRHNYPDPVARVLAEAVVLAALIGSSLKFEGRFILQTQSDGPIDMMVVDFDVPDGMRGYARFNRAAVNMAKAAGKTSTGELLGKGHLAMTVDQGRHMERYQGIVNLDGTSLEDAATHYFMQSEQIATQVRLAVGQLTEKGEEEAWRASGMLLQFFPKSGERAFADLPGDGDPENQQMLDPDFEEPDRWNEARALFGTLSDDELLDPAVSAERLLFRLYHESGVRVFDAQPLEERCRCSADRIEQMLGDSFTAEDRAEMTTEDGEIEVKCEFCSTAYHFNPNLFDLPN